jgi:glucan phosphoethanolaminetransferase (alkaline phosphatase superfamily)
MPNWMLDHTGTITAISLLGVGGLAGILIIYSVHVRNDQQKAKLAATATFVSSFILTILSSVFFYFDYSQFCFPEQFVCSKKRERSAGLDFKPAALNQIETNFAAGCNQLR